MLSRTNANGLRKLCYTSDLKYFLPFIPQSLMVSDAVYAQEWYEGNVKYQKMVVLMLLRSNKPCCLVAKGFSVVNFACFGKVGLLK